MEVTQCANEVDLTVMAWQSFNHFLYYFCSLRLDAEAPPPTQIEPVSSPPQNFSEEASGRAKQKKEGALGRCPPRALWSSRESESQKHHTYLR